MRIELRLVGPIDAEYRAELKRLASALGIAARVHIVGPTPTTHDQLAWANVVLMCSENEGFGRVTAEALKSGRPVIGARSGATTELISDGVNGLLVAPRSADELAGALRRIATEPGLIAQMSENARTGARDRFTVESELESFLEVLTAAATFRA
jgi:glycosyltransferase involved in cell wall biosynthesis